MAPTTTRELLFKLDSELKLFKSILEATNEHTNFTVNWDKMAKGAAQRLADEIDETLVSIAKDLDGLHPNKD